jgi:phage tail tape-measure protein
MTEDPNTPDEHPEPEEHGTSHLVKKQGVGGAVGTAVGTATGAAAGAVVGGFAGPAGMAIGALVGAGLGAAGGKAAGDPVNLTLEEGAGTEDKPPEPPQAPSPRSGD